jgi:hypothetical protein
MTFSKSMALELCQLNETGYTFATTGHYNLPDGFMLSPVAAISSG